MRIVIAGGGNIGYYLAKTLCEKNYGISVIDQNKKRCMMLDSMMKRKRNAVTCGDATDERILREAGIENADVLIAVTGQDQNNLVACMLAKRLFHVSRIVTRVNNPKNIRVFQAIGIDAVISSASRIADVIEQELGWSDIDSILETKTDNARIRQFLVDAGSLADGSCISKLKFPTGCIIVIAVRGSRAYIPNGDFRLEADDELMIMGSKNDFPLIEKMLYCEVQK